ncbi:hypothetical protein [Mycolicibacterium hodleri]|uniref:Transposase n=1 Tax=Mycolicibacterium hodleri TaxID=49897 RepID=A0A502E6B4_9MYCO|nr:hypothetical protein [Mycolicibacterium hodleri]TPG33027.1 hypothetical protein EAH80_16605 [Mycolicibacterium hodleri]
MIEVALAEPAVSECEAIRSVATTLSVSEDSVRRWRRTAYSAGDERAEIRRLQGEAAEMRTANEILKKTSAFLAAELDLLTTQESAG